MLANILTEISQAVPVTDTTQEFNLVEKMFGTQNDVVVVMETDDSAYFAAGFMYAYTSQTKDLSSVLVDCSAQVDQLDLRLTRQFKRYSFENYAGGNKAIRNAEANWRESMVDCTETNFLFEEIAGETHAFFEQDDWKNVLETNYQAQKEVIDSQWDQMLQSWDHATYFNAGMFEGRIWTMLI